MATPSPAFGRRALMALNSPPVGSKLILWHGEPGTGKTTALRALARSWSPWCSSQYISDPDQFFADPGYIVEAASRPSADNAAPTLATAGKCDALWSLVIAEDADEYVRPSARREAGASLGRLLNLTDGHFSQSVSQWARGDLNPHVLADTGT